MLSNWPIYCVLFQHRIQFDDTATRTFEYPSEASMLEGESSVDGETSGSVEQSTLISGKTSSTNSTTNMPTLLGNFYRCFSLPRTSVAVRLLFFSSLLLLRKESSFYRVHRSFTNNVSRSFSVFSRGDVHTPRYVSREPLQTIAIPFECRPRERVSSIN